MSEPAERHADLPRQGLGWLLGGSLAILAVTAVLFFVAVIAASLLAVILAGADVMGEFMTRMQDVADPRKEPMILDLMQVVGLALYACNAAAIWIVARFGAKMPFVQRIAWAEWTGDRQFWWLLGATLAYAISSGWLLERVHPDARNWAILPSDSLGLAASMVLICFVGPVVEEMFFRGWIYSGMRRTCSFRVTLAFTSVLFALVHYEPTHLYALAVLPVGIALGFVRERYDSIKASAFFHGLYNLFSWVLLYFTTV